MNIFSSYLKDWIDSLFSSFSRKYKVSAKQREEEFMVDARFLADNPMLLLYETTIVTSLETKSLLVQIAVLLSFGFLLLQPGNIRPV